jgi:hypothetical protein
MSEPRAVSSVRCQQSFVPEIASSTAGYVAGEQTYVF